MKPSILLFALAFATSLHAEDREFCATRPGQTTPPCVVEPGRVLVEAGLVDWTRTADAATRTDNFSFGDVLVRTGIADHAEVQVGWTAYGHETVLDRATGTRSRVDGVGDLTLAVQRAFGDTDGPVAVRAFVTLPTGTGPLASGDWGGGVMLPATIDLSRSLELDLTPEVDAAVDSNGSGRHLAYGSAIGLGLKLSERLNLAVDATAFRDDDPDNASTRLTAGASLARMIGKLAQVDVGAVVDFTTSHPGVEIYFGVARKF